ncbi:hypothetical protein OS493_004110 [Desmophyllum pertusum]|uniref:FAD dependent oxidoreductase domain-containing protein n=1 Tax=Desmophyllum pertusum TaxID=174260 RepID=A0A9W9ZW88_9CNID|nr:hypothetical protein OS493_004110 [Desmophyllum pertusum]
MPMQIHESGLPSYSNATKKSSRVPRVLVIGGGVVGVTSALQLLQKGYRVSCSKRVRFPSLLW